MTEDHASEYRWCAFKTYFQGVTNKLKCVMGDSIDKNTHVCWKNCF